MYVNLLQTFVADNTLMYRTEQVPIIICVSPFLPRRPFRPPADLHCLRQSLFLICIDYVQPRRVALRFRDEKQLVGMCAQCFGRDTANQASASRN